MYFYLKFIDFDYLAFVTFMIPVKVFKVLKLDYKIINGKSSIFDKIKFNNLMIKSRLIQLSQIILNILDKLLTLIRKK